MKKIILLCIAGTLAFTSTAIYADGATYTIKNALGEPVFWGPNSFAACKDKISGPNMIGGVDSGTVTLTLQETQCIEGNHGNFQYGTPTNSSQLDWCYISFDYGHPPTVTGYGNITCQNNSYEITICDKRHPETCPFSE